MRKFISVLPQLAAYNLKVIFANKFIWFLLASLLFYLGFMTFSVYTGADNNEELIYKLLIYPAVLLIFYPTTFGIQNDYDNRVLEILFGIPNYRYKVWLVRLVMIYVAAFILVVLFSWMTCYLLCPNNVWVMSIQIMFPLLFLGNLTFWVSTLTRSGNGTAIVMIILAIVLSILGANRDGIGNTAWDLFINPFHQSDRLNPLVWENILLKNRLYLLIGATVALMAGILNLQRRERFV